MARAQPHSNWQAQPAQARAEWNNLRDELETLLDQVHERQSQMPATRRSREHAPQETVPYANPDQRRRNALRSVQRAVQRFNEHEEAPDMPAQSPERLQSAIEQIRASQNRSLQRGATRREVAPARQMDPANSNAFADLRLAIGEISDRMSRFETLLEGRDRSAGVAEEVATQMEQLTSVVELLANSVGEQSHIKRLEGQIARLAENVTAGPDLDADTFSERLEVLSQAFDRLSVLQAEPMPEIPDYSHHLQALDSGVRLVSDRVRDLNFGAMETGLNKVSDKLEAMDFTAIEACVRSVYDRIDTLENNIAVPTPAIERLTRDLAEFTEVMRNGKGPVVTSTLVTRVDALNARLSEIEDGGQSVDGLKFDMEELRQAVSSAIEPRFNAIETQLGSLSDQFSAPSPLDASHSIAGLEGQIKRLADRLDQTGEELTHLQSLYADAPQFPEMPDFSALADMVASRAQSALAETALAKSTPDQTDDLQALEQRLSDMFGAAQKSEAPQQDLGNVERSLKSVNARLQGLEEMLARADRDRQPSQAIPGGGATADFSGYSEDTDEFDVGGMGQAEANDDDGPGASASKRRLHPGLDDGQSAAPVAGKPSHLIEGLRDTMPRPPTDDAPLNAPAFPEPTGAHDSDAADGRVPVPHSLKADDEEYAVIDNLQSDGAGGHNEFEVGTVDAGPPPPPTSDFAPNASPDGVQQSGAARMRREDRLQAAEPASSDEEGSSRSTFIAAARRAAQQNNPSDVSDAGAQSLFGRALARFQQKREATKQVEPESLTEEMPGPESITAEPQKINIPNIEVSTKEVNVDELEDIAVKESLLTKYRRPILLGAAVLAVGLLTLNLVSHRLSAGNSGTSSVSANTMAPATDEVTPPVDDATPAADSERPVNGADASPPATDFPVGSIGEDETAPQNDVRVIDPTPMADMPAPLELASFTPDMALDTPARAGLPEGLGPLELRDAAENGDARAQFEVAAIFAEGRAIPQDLAKSALWYERSAAQGFAPAAYRLGNMFENGIGVEADLVKAQFWYEKAAGYGNRMSMHNLASILAGGALGEQNFADAAVLFEKAAGLGLTDSQFNLGMLYARGLGVPQDLASSYKWFSIAAEAGDEDAVQARDDIARSLDAETVSHLQAELAAWSPQQLNIPANFAPIGTWNDDFEPGPKIENQDVIQRVQEALNKLGYDTGIPDGLIGPKTHDAVRAFESATGMTESGEINPRLLAVLGSQPV